MKEINYWEQFLKTGKIEDYLSFKDRAADSVQNKSEDRAYAGFGDSNGDCDYVSAYRGVR